MVYLKFLFVMCILVSSLIFPSFQVSCWYQRSLKGFPLLLLGQKIDQFRACRMENNSHEKVAIARSSAQTGLTHPSLPEATSLGGHPFGTEAAAVPQGFENCELWVIKGWVIGYQWADCSFASALRVYSLFFFFFNSVVGIWFSSSYFPPLALRSRILSLSVGGLICADPKEP